MAVDYQPWFTRFVGDVLPLDERRVERINVAWRHLQQLVAGDSAFNRLRPQIVPQGSYATGTAIQPLRAKDEFDVDLVIKLTLRGSVTSTTALDWLRSRLALDETFKPRLLPHPRCVRVSYAGEFHLDIVPARRVSTVLPGSGPTSPGLVRLKVPDREGGWRFSNPEGFVRWCRRQDRRTGGDFGRVVMMLKRWRDTEAPEKSRVRSIVFTTLIGRAVPTWSGSSNSPRPDARVLIATLQTINRHLRGITGIPLVKNPSLRSENLARSWTRSDFVEFHSQINQAWKLAIYIHKTGDPAGWRALFGSTFPTTP
jgi:Second Messenger Oligonucleotide or Dinucleotide Synthetase domain